jgi:TetR/AcrR family transcriptional repressor of nem operon
VPAARQSQPVLTRQVIVETAGRLFQQHGFGSVGMRQIADHLRIKAPSLYHHFASKEALAQQALERYREVQLFKLEEIDRKGHLEDKLRAYTDLYADMLDDGARPCLFLVMLREQGSLTGECAIELKLFAKQNIDWLESLLLSSGKRLRTDLGFTARRVAEMLFASLEGLMAICLVEHSPAQVFRSRAKEYVLLTVRAVFS